MKKCLFTMMDDNFFIGFECFWKSFIKHNPWFYNKEKFDFWTIDVGLSDEIKNKIKEKCDFVEFVTPLKKNYKKIDFSQTHEKLQNTYYTFEMFRFDRFERSIFIDMDVVVLGCIKDVFESSDKFSACKTYNAKLDSFGNSFNSGVFSVDNSLLTKENYFALIRLAARGYSMPDQKVFNKLFKRDWTELDKRYNVEKRMQHSEKYRRIYDQARILHFVATKPWDDHSSVNEIENSFQESEKKWWDVYNGSF